MNAVVLLSGGLDSTTVAYLAKNEGYTLYALSFDYHQRHRRELEAAKAVAEAVGAVEHRLVSFDLSLWGGSALTDDALQVPLHRSAETMTTSIPITYVPARNTIFLSFALGYAEVVGAHAVFAGMNALDYSGYPDCRPDYLAAMEEVFRLGSKAGREGKPIKILTPLLQKTKREIVEWGNILQVPWALTYSCYQGNVDSCGVCDSCTLRLNAFREAGLADPIAYAQR
ncbi:MAG: 7-cyano-7-deazaguanine synthase QueC [Gloeobacterales cyanobacterium]